MWEGIVYVFGGCVKVGDLVDVVIFDIIEVGLFVGDS